MGAQLVEREALIDTQLIHLEPIGFEFGKSEDASSLEAALLDLPRTKAGHLELMRAEVHVRKLLGVEPTQLELRAGELQGLELLCCETDLAQLASAVPALAQLAIRGPGGQQLLCTEAHKPQLLAREAAIAKLGDTEELVKLLQWIACLLHFSSCRTRLLELSSLDAHEAKLIVPVPGTAQVAHLDACRP